MKNSKFIIQTVVVDILISGLTAVVIIKFNLMSTNVFWRRLLLKKFN